jgi:hypothetical protein
MTWVASEKCWSKMYKGMRYKISTRELQTPPTMADSLMAANAWWEVISSISEDRQEAAR